MILVSSCLLGHCTKYSGGHNRCAFLAEKKDGILAVCPEVMGGLPTPRPPAEIVGGTGREVWRGHASIKAKTGSDVTREFTEGAKAVLALAKQHQVKYAVLKESSPSCGSSRIYDGTFSGTKIDGEGATVALLRAHGITVYSDEQITEELWQKMIAETE